MTCAVETAGSFARIASTRLGPPGAPTLTMATTEEDDVSSVTASSEAALLRLDQLAREAETLVEALREAASSSAAQQARVQEITTAANALTRATARATSVLNTLRTERPEEPAPAPAGSETATGGDLAVEAG